MDLNKLIKDLNRGANVAENLQNYGVSLARSYYMQASYTLGMNLIENYDRLTSFEGHDAEILSDMFAEVKLILNKLYIKKETTDLDADIKSLLSIRERIIEKTDHMGAYTYFLQIYEHILNREEYKHKENLMESDVESFLGGMMQYVAMDQDPVVINEKIQTIMGELPVRLTAGKFKDMVASASMCYAGVRSDLAEEYFEHLEGCARKISTDTLDESYEELFGICKKMADIDLSVITEAQCQEGMALLEDASKQIADILMGYLYIIDMVNDLVIIMANMSYVTHPSKDMKKAETVIHEIIQAENKGTFMRPDEDIVALLTELTDRQSIYQGEHMMLEDALYGYLGRYAKEIEGNQLFEALHLSVQLFQASPLKKLSDDKNYFAVDSEWMKLKLDTVMAQFDEAFKGTGRLVKRAIMALTFTVIPVVFNSLDDFRNYVISAIMECGSAAEKQASMDLINDLMN